MDQAERQGRALELAIAGRIRQKRLLLGWTLERLAEVTGLSKGYLSQVENGEKTPPISTLTKIAFGLGEEVVSLISGEPPRHRSRHFELVRESERRTINHTGAAPGSVYQSLGFTKPDRLMDSYLVTVSHQFPEEPLMHQGQELAINLEGDQEFHYDGQRYLLHPGDAIYFDSNRPHMSRSLGEKPAKVLVVFCNPLRPGD